MHTLRALPLVLVSMFVSCGDNNASYYRVDVAPEPAGANCTDGGLRIASGFDEDGSGVLEGVEIAQTQYVCNGTPGAPGEDGSGGAIVVKAYEAAGILMSTQGAPVTLTSATITANGPGQIVALGSADVFCMGATDCQTGATPTAAGWFWISDENTESFADHDYDYFRMNANVTESVARTTTFDVAAAGDTTIYLRGERETAYTGWFNFYRRGLTLIFLPD